MFRSEGEADATQAQARLGRGSRAPRAPLGAYRLLSTRRRAGYLAGSRGQLASIKTFRAHEESTPAVKRGTRIAVIGAGLGGATVASLLQRAGFEVRVYEQARSFERIGAGIHVSANVMKVLRHLDADRWLSQIGIHPDTFTSRKWDSGEILFELTLGATGEQKYGASYITVHRHDLHAAIVEKVQPGTIEFA